LPQRLLRTQRQYPRSLLGGQTQISSTPVEIHVSEKLVLRGERYGEPGERWAVLLHEEGRDLDGWRPLVGRLLELTPCALAVDLAGHGASADPWEPRRLPADVLAVLRFAESQGARRVFVLGAGAGATAALAAAGECDVEAIVALSPKLIVVGSQDAVAAAEAEDVFRRTIGWGLLQSLPTRIQGTALLESAWAEQVAENALAFLRDYV
jgi:pimeloyl-ACP methyl ester carboxylesterase